MLLFSAGNGPMLWLVYIGLAVAAVYFLVNKMLPGIAGGSAAFKELGKPDYAQTFSGSYIAIFLERAIVVLEGKMSSAPLGKKVRKVVPFSDVLSYRTDSMSHLIVEIRDMDCPIIYLSMGTYTNTEAWGSRLGQVLARRAQ